MNERLFEGKYRIVSILGQGGMSTVYLAENIKLGTLWAIKEINKKPGTKSDLFVEPNILKKLNHPALPRVFDVVEDEKSIYIIVDYIEGESLYKLQQAAGKFSEKAVVDWAKQLCGVLNYLHTFKPNPIIYRDMKPSNIILARDGNIKLIDFGIAREYKQEAGSDTVYIGTRGYAAPEQYGFGQTNVTTDIYSLGITMFHLATGINPNNPSCEIKPVRCYNKELSIAIENVIARCVKYKPSDRYQSVRELLADLESIEMLNGWNSKSERNFRDGKHQGTSFRDKSSGSVVTFKKLIITVPGNPEFACELAYMAAYMTSINVLVVDLDTLNATADEYLNVPKYPKNIRSFDELINNTGLNICMDAADKKILTREIFLEAAIQKTKNLYVLTGNYNLTNFEYYNETSLSKILEKAYELFDITILITSKFIYDAFTLLALHKSDYNIIPVRADKIALREFNRYLVYLKDKQNIPLEKSKFVAFEYNPDDGLKKDVLNELTEGNCIGSVQYCGKRRLYRNMRTIYAKNMDRRAKNEYVDILSKFNIIPRRTLLDKSRDILYEWAVRARKVSMSGRNVKDADSTDPQQI